MLTRLFSLVSYAAFFGVFVYFMGFVAGVGVPKTVDDGLVAPLPLAVAVDVWLVLFFGAVHSVMARASFKRAWTRLVRPAAERSVYVLVATAQIALLCWQWRPISTPLLWSTHGAAAWALGLAGGLGWGIMLLSSFLIDHFELFGLRQAFARPRPATGLLTPFLYRWVRHPLYLGVLIGLWVTPSMSAGHLLLALTMSAYILVGVHHEERDLVRHFGDEYRRYQERVPRLLPFRLRPPARLAGEVSSK